MMPYERFDAWKSAHGLALEVYRITDSWPVGERYGLTSQLRRAALSIPTNIAEGTAKRGPRSYLLHFSKDRGIIDEDTFRRLSELRHQSEN
jgi:23S rRNA-intervening sequence protein